MKKGLIKRYNFTFNYFKNSLIVFYKLFIYKYLLIAIILPLIT
jgi:hypothetical protein